MWVDFFEAFMLICFGSAWPFAIAKSWQSRLADGKSPLFLVIIFTGYISGICTHFWREYSPVVFLYGLNATMVAIDLWLVLHFRRHPGKLPNMGQGHGVMLDLFFPPNVKKTLLDRTIYKYY